MTPLTFIHLLGALIYAMAPYALLAIVLSPRQSADEKTGSWIMYLPGSLAACCLFGTSVSFRSFDMYRWTHAAILVATSAPFILRCRRQPHLLRAVFAPASLPWPLAVVLTLTFASRVIPWLFAPESLGEGDARFHNILGFKILLDRVIPSTWEPFAPIPVMYPRGSHFLAAFLADLAGCPIHVAFDFLIVILAVFTAAAIHRLGWLLFNNRQSAVLAAASYSFLTVWGSLDYYRWGGIPNALGMLLLLFMVALVIEAAELGDLWRRRIRILMAAATLVAILLIHHYTWLVAVLCLCAGLITATDRPWRRTLTATISIGAAFCLPFFLYHYLPFARTAGSSDTFSFREPILYIWSCASNIGVCLVALFLLAWWLARHREWSAGQLFMLASSLAMFAAFVFLEYVYRGITLWVTSGKDCFTALTPSRMLTDMVYPMAVLTGFIPLSSFWRPRAALGWLVITAAGLATCLPVWREQSRMGVSPQTVEAGRWLREHTPANAMLVGRLPHVEYLAWRETATPPLPASEQRRSPYVLWKEESRAVGDWLAWQTTSGRPVYFLCAPQTPSSPPMRKLFENSEVAILTRSTDTH